MGEDVERLLDSPEPSSSSTAPPTSPCSIWDYVYIYKMPHLSDEQLAGLARYKYSAIDTSPLSKYVMHPLWNWGVTFFPTWLAPNVITFAGYCCLLLDYVLLAHYDWNLDAQNSPGEGLIPRWVWFVVAISHAASHHLDGMDGKQARRTGSGTPLGELMDHGIDSNCMWMLPVTLMSVLGSNPANSGIEMVYAPALLLLMTFNFWVSHWEKYNTGILYLPWAFDIAQTAVVGLFLLAGFLTPDGLKQLCADHLMPINTMLYYAIPFGFVGALGLSVYNIYVSIQAGTHKRNSFSEMMRPWASYVLFNLFLLSFTVFCKDAFLENPRVWTIAYGFTFSSVVCRLMVDQTCDSRCNLIEPPIIPLFFAWFLSVVLQIAPSTVMMVYSVFALCSFCHYAYIVINDICDHLNICAFSITSKRR